MGGEKEEGSAPKAPRKFLIFLNGISRYFTYKIAKTFIRGGSQAGPREWILGGESRSRLVHLQPHQECDDAI